MGGGQVKKLVNGHRKIKPNGISIADAIDLVMADGQRRNVNQIRREAKKIYGNIKKNSLSPQLVKLQASGKIKRVEKGIFVKAK